MPEGFSYMFGLFHHFDGLRRVMEHDDLPRIKGNNSQRSSPVFFPDAQPWGFKLITKIRQSSSLSIRIFGDGKLLGNRIQRLVVTQRSSYFQHDQGLRPKHINVSRDHENEY